MLPCSRDERRRIVLSLDGIWRTWQLGLEAEVMVATVGWVKDGLAVLGEDLSFSAREISPAHFLLKRERSAGEVASCAAFMYKSAAVMA